MIQPLNPEVFEKFADELGSHDLAVVFLDSFTFMLSDRITRIESAMRLQDREETITALLSLHSSAAMVGAAQLEASTAEALATHQVEALLVGPLVRKLQGQAGLLGQVTASLRTIASAQEIPAIRRAERA
jgi:hypothetical protein